MELLYAVAEMTGLPVEAVVDTFMVNAKELGLDLEKISIEDIQNVLSYQLDQSIPSIQKQLKEATLN